MQQPTTAPATATATTIAQPGFSLPPNTTAAAPSINITPATPMSSQASG